MNIALVILAYLAISFLVCWAMGNGMKRTRAMSLGISLDEDTRRQDEAQLEWLARRRAINTDDM